MLELLLSLLAAARVFFRSRGDAALGSPCAPAASRRAQAPTAAADVDPHRPPFLDGAPALVAAMVGCVDHRQAGDGGQMASRRVSPVLALAIPATWRPAEDQRRNSDA